MLKRKLKIAFEEFQKYLLNNNHHKHTQACMLHMLMYFSKYFCYVEPSAAPFKGIFLLSTQSLCIDIVRLFRDTKEEFWERFWREKVIFFVLLPRKKVNSRIFMKIDRRRLDENSQQLIMPSCTIKGIEKSDEHQQK